MDKVHEMLRDKRFGFYATGVVAVFALVAAIVCATSPFAQSESIGLVITFLLVASIVALLLLIVPTVLSAFIKIDNVWYQSSMKALVKIAPWILLAFSLFALLPLTNIVYTYISVNSTSKTAQDIIDMIVENWIVADMFFIILTVIAATVAVFLPSYEKDTETITALDTKTISAGKSE